MASRQSSRCGDTCGICFDTLTDPRELTCTHSFCLVPCLTRLIDSARQDYGTTFMCPLCRRTYPISVERTSEDIAKSFRRKIQRRILNDGSRHRMTFPSHIIKNDNNQAIENGNISSNGRGRNFTLTRLQNQRINIDTWISNNSTNYFLDFDNVPLPSINGPNMAQAAVVRRNSTPDSGNLDDEFVIPNTPDSGNLDDQFCFPMSPDVLEVNNDSLFTNVPTYFHSNNSINNQNRIPVQHNPFEPRGINIVNFNIRNYIVQDPTPRQTPRRKPSPKTGSGLNSVRLPPISPLQKQSNDASIKNSEMSHDMEQDAINCVINANDRFNEHKDIAGYVKREFDRKYNQTWHCIVGTAFGSFVTHENNCFIYFKVSGLFVLLFKSG